MRVQRAIAFASRFGRRPTRWLLWSLPLLVAAWFAVRSFDSPELAWRLVVLEAKARGELPQIPLRHLIAWLAPGSPVYLAALAKDPNPHAVIRNEFTKPEDLGRGRALFRDRCAQCHGDTARGMTGPSLIDATSIKSDWSFFSTVKWGLLGTSMQPQPVGDTEIWQLHAFLRDLARSASGLPGAARVSTPARAPVNVAAGDIAGGPRSAGEWLTYAGNYLGHRHSTTPGLNKDNIARLRLAWAAQLRSNDRDLQATPIVAGGVMYVSESREGVVALDARTGEVIWTYRRPVPDGLSLCCGMPNRGVAVLGQTVFVVTIDAFLVALDANTGRPRWITKVVDYRDGYTMTGAPLALEDRIVVGVAGGEFGARGFIAAFSAADGKLAWKFNTVPEPGEFGHDTWAGDSWKTGGAGTWSVGAYDPGLGLVYWGVGNPSPVYDAAMRRGDNLFSNSIVAIEAKTGRLRWHFQFIPNDDHDWDSNQQPVLAEVPLQGRPRSVVLFANRNAFFYALDRSTGEFLYAKPFAKQTWNEGFDGAGRPRVSALARPTPAGSVVWPVSTGATNWAPPSYDPARQLVFIPSTDAASTYYLSQDVRYRRGERFEGGSTSVALPNLPASSHVTAVDARSGDIRWRATVEVTSNDLVRGVGGVLSTAGGVVFAGYRSFFRAFDADSGRELWKLNLGGNVRGSPISFTLDGRDYVAVSAGHSVFAFELPH